QTLHASFDSSHFPRKYISIGFALAFLAIKASAGQRNDDALTHFYGIRARNRMNIRRYDETSCPAS
ncbi:hypothetical protein, partial [Agrobacterium sp.]|uniref:hypothetical protein n=1 Tax=Agrobacterium sp. TaxID=361 RepID=UPI0040347731